MNEWTDEILKDGTGIKLETKTVEKLSDDELDDISGGFTETNKGLATFGYNIKCPNCGATAATAFEAGAWQDKKMKSVEYHCGCGCKFVCYDGYVIKKDRWVNLCNQKGYKYPFA